MASNEARASRHVPRDPEHTFFTRYWSFVRWSRFCAAWAKMALISQHGGFRCYCGQYFPRQRY